MWSIGNKRAQGMWPIGNTKAQGMWPVGNTEVQGMWPIGNTEIKTMWPIGNIGANGMWPVGNMRTKEMWPVGNMGKKGMRSIENKRAQGMWPIGNNGEQEMWPFGNMGTKGMWSIGSTEIKRMWPIGNMGKKEMWPIGNMGTKEMRSIGNTRNLTNRKYQDTRRVTGPVRGPFACIPFEGFWKAMNGHHKIAFGTSLSSEGLSFKFCFETRILTEDFLLSIQPNCWTEPEDSSQLPPPVLSFPIYYSLITPSFDSTQSWQLIAMFSQPKIKSTIQAKTRLNLDW